MTSTPIKYILDAASTTQTQQMAYDILAPGGHLQLVQHPEISPSTEKTLGFTKGLRSASENAEPFTTLYKHLTELLQKGLIKVCMLPLAIIVGVVNKTLFLLNSRLTLKLFPED